MGAFDKLYAHLPILGQHAAVTLYGVYWYALRFGPGYSQYVKDYLNRENFDKAQWDAWQAAQLKSLLSVCAEHVPYYRDTWTESQKRAAKNGDLTQLPLLEKEPLRASVKLFLHDNIHPFHSQLFYTSGSTGTPISTYYTVSELRETLALRETRLANWAGVSFKLPRATFSGRMVEPNPESKGPFHRYNAIEKQIYFSAFHLRPDTARQYVDAMKHHNIQWGMGYTVSFYLLACFMLDQKIPPPGLKAIVTTSEKLTPKMRTVMEEAFDCKIHQEYSTVENAVFASECEHKRLHISPDVGVVEILRDDGSFCQPSEIGEVVVTPLTRYYEPLIRFRIGDLAAWDDEPCLCGRAMPVIKEIVGRIEDVVVGPDGRQMVRFHGIFVNQPHVREGQIVQEALDHIRAKVVVIDGFNENDISDITHRIQQRLGSAVKVTVEPVSFIPRTQAGKFKAVVSLLKN